MLANITLIIRIVKIGKILKYKKKITKLIGEKMRRFISLRCKELLDFETNSKQQKENDC